MQYLSDRISVRMTPWYCIRLQAIAREYGVTPTELVREALIRLIQDHDKRKAA
jgi:DNA-binding GntR family transcriptional regulator